MLTLKRPRVVHEPHVSAQVKRANAYPSIEMHVFFQAHINVPKKRVANISETSWVPSSNLWKKAQTDPEHENNKKKAQQALNVPSLVVLSATPRRGTVGMGLIYLHSGRT